MCTACSLQVMMGFQSSILDTVEVMEHVSALLQGHGSLLRQFNESLSMLGNSRPDGGRAGHLRFQAAPTRLLMVALWARVESHAVWMP